MPIYDYECVNGHLCELRRGYDDVGIDCPVCGAAATRENSVYDQYIFTETGMKSGRRVDTPRDEKRYDVSLFREACAEVAYSHDKAEQLAQRKLPKRNLWGEAKKKAADIMAGKAPPVKAESRFKHG